MRFAMKKTSMEYVDYAENEVQTMLDLRHVPRAIKLYAHQRGPDAFYMVHETCDTRHMRHETYQFPSTSSEQRLHSTVFRSSLHLRMLTFLCTSCTARHDARTHARMSLSLFPPSHESYPWSR